MTSLNVQGNITGSGTALTNLNYNAITNKPDLTGYAINTNLNIRDVSSLRCDFGRHVSPDVSSLILNLKSKHLISGAASNLH